MKGERPGENFSRVHGEPDRSLHPKGLGIDFNFGTETPEDYDSPGLGTSDYQKPKTRIEDEMTVEDLPWGEAEEMSEEELAKQEKEWGEEDLLYEYLESKIEGELKLARIEEYVNRPRWRELTPGEKEEWKEFLEEKHNEKEYRERIMALAAKHAPVPEDEKVKERIVSVEPVVEEAPPKFTTEERKRLQKSNKIFTRRHEIPKYKNKIGPTIRRRAA